MNIEPLATLKDVVLSYPVERFSPETRKVKEFADANKFEYFTDKDELVQYSWHDYYTTPAWLGPVGISFTKHAYHVVSGNYLDYKFTMFLMWDDTLQYESNPYNDLVIAIDQHSQGIIRVQLPKAFPQIVLDSNKNDDHFSSVGNGYKDSQRLSLEGDFPSYFDLYAPKNLQVNILTLLAPNMMQILKNHAGLFDVEFNGNEMILMTRGQLYDPNVMATIEEALAEQLKYLDRLMPSWNYSPLHGPFDRLQKNFIGGAGFKFGRYRASMQKLIYGFLIVCVAIVILSILF